MRSLITYFIKYPVAANTLMVLILIFGYFGLQSLRSTFFPEQESKFISIQAVYPGSSPSEIEEGIVLKIEDNLESVTGIERITSTTIENLASITIEVSNDYATETVLQDVKNEVDRINSFPDGMEPPAVYIFEPAQLAISFALLGEVSLKELKEVARQVEEDLKKNRGLSKIDLLGFPDEEIEIALNKEVLKQYGLSFSDLAQQIQLNSLELTGGEILGDKENYLIRSYQKGRYGDDFLNIPIRSSKSGTVLKLKDVAVVKDHWAHSSYKKEYNGKQAIIVNVNYTINEDMLSIVEMVKKYLNEFNVKNELIKAEVVNNRSKILKERIELLTENGVVGFFLVLIFLSLFLHPRLAAWVALSIPICFAGMFILAAFVNISINVISLFGMIIVIGILVDDGIVISENIYQHFESGKSPVKAAIDGTMEVFPAVFSAIATTVAAFSIFYFLDGVMGDFFVEMGFVVIATLIFSLVEGLFILPAHIAHSKALTSNSHKKPLWILERFTLFLNWTRLKFYAPILNGTLKKPLITLIVFVVVLLVSQSLLKADLVKFSFFPSIQREFLDLKLEMQPGTSEQVTEFWMDYVYDKVEAVNQKLSEIEGSKVIVGMEKTIEKESHKAALKLVLSASEEREISTDGIRNEILFAVDQLPDKEKFSVSSGGPFGRAVSIAFYSTNDSELDIVKNKFQEALLVMGTLTNIESSDEMGSVELSIQLNDKAKALGLNNFEVMQQVRNAFFGYEVQRIQRGLDEVKVWVRYAAQNRNKIGDLEQLELVLGNNRFLARDLFNIEAKRGVVAIKHIDGKKTILVEADIINEEKTSSGEIASFVMDSILPPLLAAHPSVSYSQEGQAREIAKTSRSIKFVGPVILILMFSIVLLTFRSLTQALSVFIMSAFGIIGILWGHLIHGHHLSIFSIFGIIALIGVMINDSLVFINAFNNFLKQGMTYKIALFQAGISRYRPIVLTSATTIAGLAPLIFEKSLQAQFLIPMAITIAYGLLFATFLTLIFLPALLLVINFLRRITHWIWKGVWLSREAIEPAVRELYFEQSLAIEDEVDKK